MTYQPILNQHSVLLFHTDCQVFPLHFPSILPLYAVPDVTVVTSNSTNDAILGESYILNCTVLGADSLNGTIFIQWSKPGTLQTKVGTGKHLLLLLMNLDLSDAGQYTCNTTVTSPYVRNEIIAESIETLFVASKKSNYFNEKNNFILSSFPMYSSPSYCFSCPC